jgi:bacitracin transport system ATP-binding protein
VIEYLTEQEVLNMDTNYIIETKNLTKQYGSQKSVADLNIHVKRGRIYGLLGRNGAGKTTTMKMLLGLTKPTSGEVKIWGKSLQGNEKKLLPRIGSLIESPGFYPNLTGTENLRIFATLRGVPNNHAIKDALDLVGLPYKDKKLFSQYSLGMKQRLAIALAVMHDQRPRSHRYCRSTLLYSGALRRKRKNYFDFQSHSFGDFFAG